MGITRPRHLPPSVPQLTQVILRDILAEEGRRRSRAVIALAQRTSGVFASHVGGTEVRT
jgi:hypothetical protein